MTRIVHPNQDLAKPTKKAKVKKKKTKTERQKAKEAAWDSFSKYIRLRDCLKYKNDPENGICITCRRDYPFKKLQAGHFLAGRGNAVLFDEEGVHSQCFSCNGNPPFGKGGNYIEYFLFMEREYGREKIDEMLARKKTTVVYKIHDFIELRQRYDRMYKELYEEYVKSHPRI